MKQIMVLAASIILGLFIYELIAGSGNSLKNILKERFVHEFENMTVIYLDEVK